MTRDDYLRLRAEIRAAPLTWQGEIASIAISHVLEMERRLAEAEGSAARALGDWRRRLRADAAKLRKRTRRGGT